MSEERQPLPIRLKARFGAKLTSIGQALGQVTIECAAEHVPELARAHLVAAQCLGGEEATRHRRSASEILERIGLAGEAGVPTTAAAAYASA